MKTFAAQSGITDVRVHRIWVESSAYPGSDPDASVRTPRPAQFDLSASLALLRDVIAERRLLNKRIGLELGFVPAADYSAFTALPVAWEHYTNVVERLRAIKAPLEIECLRNAAEYARAGFIHLAGSIAVGMDAGGMTERSGKPAPSRKPNNAVILRRKPLGRVAGDGFAPGVSARDGDRIKIDVGCVVSGYGSDGGRTVVLGTPDADAERIYDALHRALDTGFAMLKPGSALADVYRATATCMWDNWASKHTTAAISATALGHRSGARNGPSSRRHRTRCLTRAWCSHSRRRSTLKVSAASS